MLIDLGSGFDMPEAKTLLQNLKEYSSIFAQSPEARQIYKDKSPSELCGLVEQFWTIKILRGFHNITLKGVRTVKLTLTDLLAKFNKLHDFKVIQIVLDIWTYFFVLVLLWKQAS